MEIKRVFVKTRAEFGKQCIFDMYGPTMDVDISPSPALMNDYIRRTYCHVGVQHTTQFAMHQAQTDRKAERSSGMSHYEGGWPKEVNPKDEEATMRFRRRVEKDDNWAPKLRKLFNMVEQSVLQNGTMDIYQHFFDDMIPKPLVQTLGFRTVNVYEDPEKIKRPVTCISMSPDLGSRLAVCYCFLDYGMTLNYSKKVYIWQVENPNEPYTWLEPFAPCVVLEYNPRDPSVLASGLMTGQVCNWDLRTGQTPVQLSHLQFSHREFVNAIKWITTKTNTEFFSISTDGRAMWWDTRKLREPIEALMFDLEYPNEPHMDRAIGISSLNSGPTIGTKFMFGLENGMVISGSRKMKTNAEKLAIRYETHFGQVYSVDRNGLNPSIFLTVGAFRARIWSEDTREGNLASTPYLRDFATAGCWSKSRYSVFYVITASGHFLVWDILQQLRKPVFTMQLCKEKLTAIAPFDEGSYVAIGNGVGSVYLVEPTEFFASFDKKDRSLFSEYIDKCSKLTKAVDVRLKEIKLVQRVQAESDVIAEAARTKEKRGARKSAAKAKDKDPRASKEKLPKEKMPKKIREEFGPDIIAAEAKYYEAVQKGLEAYADETDPAIIPVAKEQVSVKKPDKKSRRSSQAQKEDEKKQALKEQRAKRKSLLVRRAKSVKTSVQQSAMLSDQEQQSAALLSAMHLTGDEARKRKKSKARVALTLPVPCKDVVCKPKICCRLTRKRKKGKRKAKLDGQTEVAEESVEQPVRRPTRYRRRMSMIKWMQAPPVVLTSEAAFAREEIRMLTRMGKLRMSITHPKPKSSRPGGKRKVRYGVESKKSEEELPSSKEEGRKRKVIRRRVCALPRAKTTEKLFSEILGVPMPEMHEEKVSGRQFLEKYHGVRGRVFPRISEFGQTGDDLVDLAEDETD